MNTKSYVTKKDYTPSTIRTINADQTAYSKDNHAGFWLFIAALLGGAGYLATFLF